MFSFDFNNTCIYGIYAFMGQATYKEHNLRENARQTAAEGGGSYSLGSVLH